MVSKCGTVFNKSGQVHMGKRIICDGSYVATPYPRVLSLRSVQQGHMPHHSQNSPFLIFRAHLVNAGWLNL